MPSSRHKHHTSQELAGQRKACWELRGVATQAEAFEAPEQTGGKCGGLSETGGRERTESDRNRNREPGKGSRRYIEQFCFLYLLWGMRVGLKGEPGAGGFVEIFWQSRGWILILHGPDPAPTAMWERESFGCRSSASRRAL